MASAVPQIAENTEGFSPCAMLVPFESLLVSSPTGLQAPEIYVHEEDFSPAFLPLAYNFHLNVHTRKSLHFCRQKLTTK
jgi:hypothetical protein